VILTLTGSGASVHPGTYVLRAIALTKLTQVL
jgi:hypothetical protein